MPSISSISIIIKASVKPFLKGLKKAVRGTIKFTSSLVDLTKQITVYGAALLAITLGALTLFLKKQFAIIDAVAKTGRALGLTVDFLEGMKFAGTQLGVSQEKIIKSLKRFTRTMGEAQLGFGTGQTAFQAWGRSVEEFQGLNVEKSFLAVSKELRKIKDSTKQSAIAFQFFGRNGIEMLNIINENKDSIVGFLKESRRLKGAFNTLDVRQVEAANDAVDKISSALDGIGKQIAFTISPAIRVFSNRFVTGLIKIRELFERNEDGIKLFIKQVFKLAGPVLLQLKSNFVAIFQVISGLFSQVGPLAIDIFRDSILKFFIDVEFATRNWGRIWEIVLLEMQLMVSRLKTAGVKFQKSFGKELLIVRKVLADMLIDIKIIDAFVTLIKPSNIFNPDAAKEAQQELNNLHKQRIALQKKFAKDAINLALQGVKTKAAAEKAANKIKLMREKIDLKKVELFKAKKKFQKSRIEEIENDMKRMLKNLDDLLLDFGKTRITEPLTRPVEDLKLPALALKGSQEAAKILEQGKERNIQEDLLKEEKKQTAILEKLRKMAEKRQRDKDLNIAVAGQVVDTVNVFLGGTP